jgi:hypothetical protein
MIQDEEGHKSVEYYRAIYGKTVLLDSGVGGSSWIGF